MVAGVCWGACGCVCGRCGLTGEGSEAATVVSASQCSVASLISLRTGRTRTSQATRSIEENTHTRTHHGCHGVSAAGGPYRSRDLLRHDLHHRAAAQRRVRCAHRSETCSSPRIWCAPSLRLPHVLPRPGRMAVGRWMAVRKDRHQARRVSANSPSGTYEIARHDTKSRDITLPPGAEKARQGSRIDLVSRAFPGAVG